MAQNSAVTPYEKQYRDIQFERAGLFQLIQAHYKTTELLYPGSSVHITPSFYFPHVVYVDTSTQAIEFFSQKTAVLNYINRHKTYKRSAYFQFIAQNYTEALPIRAGQFDLLLALFAPDIVQPCHKYLKKNGLLVTNNFQDEAVVAANMPEFDLETVVQYRQKAYQLVIDKPMQLLLQDQKVKSKRYLKQTSTGFAYAEQENYFVFRKNA